MSDAIYLEWKDLNYAVKKRHFNWRKFKFQENNLRILSDANGIVKSGELVAILGSSGAGKTTLLAAISQRIRGNVSGQILINSRPITRREMIQRSSFVPQFDIAVDSLTAREHLFFMCELRMDRRVSRFQKNDRINETLWKLGLMKIAECRIATLSGGERKMLNLATELLTDPQIVFCDEITTGLDSYNALNVIKSLQLLTTSKENLSSLTSPQASESDQINLLDAVEMNVLEYPHISSKKAIICSIHQPTSEVFECFSHVILMQSGRICFQGTVNDARSYFWRRGFQCPDMCNPAEFFIDTMSKGGILSEQKENEKNRFASSRVDQIHDGKMKKLNGGSLPNEKIEFDRVRWIFQLFILLKRTFLESKRTLKEHCIKSMSFIITAVAISLLYSSVPPNKQQSIQDINGFVFTLAAEIIFATSYGIIFFYPSTLPILRRETGEHIYDLSAFYVATFLGCIPKSFLNAYVFLTIIYVNIGFVKNFWLFVQMGFTLTMTGIPATAYGLMLSGVFESVRLSSELAPPIDLFMFLISGWYIKTKLSGFLQYFSLFFYCMEALSIQIWTGISEIDCNPTPADNVCFHNGTEVLNMLTYEADTKWVWIDYAGLLGIAAVMHVIGYVGVRRMVNKSGYY